MTKQILLAAGGTGGHMFPAQALAEELRGHGYNISLITDKRGASYTSDFPADHLFELPMQKGLGTGLKAMIGLPLRSLSILAAIRRTRKILERLKPDFVMGFGGYPAFPAMQMALMQRYPYGIHEQNAVLGRVNRRFASGARFVASGFERLEKLPAGADHHVTGNPVRNAVELVGLALPDNSKISVERKLNILVIGGSQGARILSLGVTDALAQLAPDLQSRIELQLQCRAENIEEAHSILSATQMQYEVKSFFDDMPTRYAKTDLVIARAGASSCAEIALVGRPSILIPFAAAKDDHQRKNALALAAAAELISEQDFSTQQLAGIIQRLAEDPKRRLKMAQDVRAQARPDAASALAKLVIRNL